MEITMNNDINDGDDTLVISPEEAFDSRQTVRNLFAAFALTDALKKKSKALAVSALQKQPSRAPRLRVIQNGERRDVLMLRR
jgi:hypothetical protein